MKAKKASAKGDSESKLLAKYEHHLLQQKKHRAHAELIAAKLKTQGKRIVEDYEMAHKDGMRKGKRKIVEDS